MVLLRNERKYFEEVFKRAMNEESMEDFLDRFDLTPEEVLMFLYESGQLDPEQIKEVYID